MGCKKRRGTTLVEVLFAVFLVAVGAVVVAATMPVASASRAKSDLYNKATGLAQKQLEAIRGAGYGNITATQLYALGLIDSTEPIEDDTYSFSNSDLASLDSPALVLPSGKGYVSVEQLDLDLRKVVVKVEWDWRGEKRTVTVGTTVANL